MEKNYEALDDHALMACVREDDARAFEALVLRWQAPALRYCQKITGNSFGAQDIVQDSFADIYMQRKKYEPSFTFQAYLYGMIRHKAVDEIRKSVRVILAEDEKPGQWQNAGEEKTISGKTQGRGALSPEELFILQEDREWLYACMRTLKEDYRRALYLYSVEDMSYGEIAAAMGKTMAQVKIYIYRARKILRKSVKGREA